MGGATTTVNTMLAGETWRGEAVVVERKGGVEAITKEQIQEHCSHLKQTDR